MKISNDGFASRNTGSAWNSVGFPAADVMGVFIKGKYTMFNDAKILTF